jgi:hypothetical protein
MEPTQWDWDSYNYCDNANADISYNCEANTWEEGHDWSNNYADDWHDYEASATSFVEDMPAEVHHEEHHAEEHVEPAPAVEPAPVHTHMGDDEEHVEPAPVVEEAPIDPNQPEG